MTLPDILPLRRAEGADAGAVAALTAAAYQTFQARIGYPPLPVTQDYAEVIARDEVWLLEDADELLGILVLVEAPDHLLIYSLAVAPQQQGEGLGRRLMAHAEDRARAKGLGKLQLYTNALMPENIAFYGGLGYRETGREPHPTRPGATVVYMEKSL